MRSRKAESLHRAMEIQAEFVAAVEAAARLAAHSLDYAAASFGDDWTPQAQAVYKRITAFQNLEAIRTPREVKVATTEAAIEALDCWGTNGKRAAGLAKYHKELGALNGQD